MAEYPSVGFRTNVKDDELTSEIVETVAEEFDGTVHDGEIRIDPSTKIIFGVVENNYDPYFGHRADGLVFTYYVRSWVNWDSLLEAGELIQEIAQSIDERFKFVDVEEVIPVVRHT